MDPLEHAPLILTARMEPAAQERFTALRTAHFPPSRNYLSAHITLFHALPGDELETVQAILAQEAAEQAPLESARRGHPFSRPRRGLCPVLPFAAAEPCPAGRRLFALAEWPGSTRLPAAYHGAEQGGDPDSTGPGG